MRSVVILCCIKPFEDKINCSAKEFLNLASCIGEVDKIMIFSRKKIVKMFIQFKPGTFIESSFEEISNTECSFGKIQMFKSERTEIVFHNTNPNDSWLFKDDQEPSSQLISQNPNETEQKNNPTKLNSEKPLAFDPNSEKLLCKKTLVQKPLHSQQFVSNIYHLTPNLNQINNNLLMIQNCNDLPLQFDSFLKILAIFGKINDFRISQRKSSAFVHYKSNKSAQTALLELHNFKFLESYLSVSFASQANQELCVPSRRATSSEIRRTNKAKNQLKNTANQPNRRITKLLLLQPIPAEFTLHHLMILLNDFINQESIVNVEKVGNNEFLAKIVDIYESARLYAQIEGFRLNNSRIRPSFLNENNSM